MSNDGRRTLRIAILAVVTVILVVAIWWGASVLLSPVTGAGNAIRAKNEASNRIAQQEGFHQRYEDILATDAKIGILAAAAAANPADTAAARTLVGVKAYCLSAVAEYNAKALSFRAEDFRDADLPARIDTTDPRTDCKENTP